MKAEWLGVERRALRQVWRRKKLLAAQLVGNAALIGGAYAWLGVAEADWLAAMYSATLALLVIFAGLWLHTSALAGFYEESHRWPGRVGLRRLPRVLPWAALGVGVVVAAVWLAGYAPRMSAWLASLLTLRLRSAVSPRQVEWVYPALVRGLACVLLLVVVPLASQAAGGGSVRAGLRVAARPRYWLACAALVLVGLYLPARLLGWVPAYDSLTARVASTVVRFGLAYALAVTAWLTLAALAAQHARPPDPQHALRR